jgi:hypothetical protein
VQQQIKEQQDSFLHQHVEPLRNELSDLRDRVVTKEDLEDLRKEMRKERAAQPSAAQSTASAGSRASSAGPSSAAGGNFDPWAGYYSHRASASSEVTDRVSEQVNLAAAQKSAFIPREVNVGGWSPWGANTPLPRDRAAKLIEQLRANLPPNFNKEILEVRLRDLNFKVVLVVSAKPGLAEDLAAAVSSVIDRLALTVEGRRVTASAEIDPDERRRRGILGESARSLEGWVGEDAARAAKMRILWDVGMLKAGFYVLGKIHGGEFRWSGKNLQGAFPDKSMEDVEEFITMCSGV